MERRLTVKMEKRDDGRALRDVLRGRLHVSHRLLTALKARPGGILLNGAPARVCDRVKEGDTLLLLLEASDSRSENILPTPGALEILYEDEDLLVLNKPPNLPVHPSKGHVDDSLANIVAWHYARRGQNFIFRCVNRLDSGTSGVMAVAKNAYAHERLIAQMRAGKLQKEYLGIAEGTLPQDEGRIDLPVGRPPGVATIRREVREDGSPAVTLYRVLRRTGRFTLLSLRPLTGRTHQLRVHLAALGCPLAGDFLYGTEDRALIPRHALHAHRLSFDHPVTGVPLKFQAPLPEDMLRLLRLPAHAEKAAEIPKTIQEGTRT